MYKVVTQEGWGRLYGGLAPSLVGTAASQGVYYYFYQIFRERAEAASLSRQRKGFGDGSLGVLQSLVVAALAGSVNVLLTNPIWIIVTRMQTHRKMRKTKPSHVLSVVPMMWFRMLLLNLLLMGLLKLCKNYMMRQVS
ncbi:hypothetical protein HPP92_019208 [Vanilla planifolia]|uniref:Uncharacterized protein n=1 Tax=Vanilla planifolia TaxID=51239 RepID=A0A835QF44_VANPL|nr:hypothetical protein HPP92_019208 [Vanilla planifolia]